VRPCRADPARYARNIAGPTSLDGTAR
jgi:hypothetical protein